MLPQQAPYTTPREEIRAEMPPRPVEQRPISPEYNEQFIETLAQRLMPRLMPEMMRQLSMVQSSRLRLRAFSINMALIVVSMVFMLAAVGIMLSGPVLAALGVTGALIGIGIAGLVLICINVLFSYMLFTNTKE